MHEAKGTMDETGRADGAPVDWRSIVEVAGAAVFIFQGETLRYLNQAAVALSGYEPAELLGRPFWTIIALEDRDRTQERGLARQTGGKPPDRYEVRIVRKDGTTRVVDFVGRVIDWHGCPAVLGVARDITDRVRAERQLAARGEKLSRLLAATVEGIIALDQDGRCTFANPAATRTLGYLAAESLVGRPLHPLVHHTCADGAPYPADRCPIIAAARSGTPAHVENESFACKDGTLIPIEYWVHPVQGDGEAPGAVLAFWDVRDRLRTAEERARLRRKRDQRQRLESLGVLAGGVAHEFNNILQAIVGNAALVQKAFHVEEVEHDCCEEVLRASRRAARLCQEMLAYSGKGRFVVERLDLSDEIRDLARLLESAVAPPAVLEVSLAPDLPSIEADRSQLQQVALNLASNAREAYRTDAGPVSIRTYEYTEPPGCPGTACFGRVRPDRRYVALEVKDDGEGLNAVTLERIFDPFFSTKETGRGLGLSAALGIVRAHDAVLCVDSNPGRGSTFRVLWPVAEINVSARGPVTTPGPPRPFRGTVLLAEDEPSVRRSAERLLQAFGFAVLVADDGQSAIDLLAAEPDRVSIALLDIVMPSVSGEEAFWKLRAIRPDLPVVLMSGYTVSRVPETIRGMASFLQKPFTPDTLAAKLAEALGQSAPLRPLRGPQRLL